MRGIAGSFESCTESSSNDKATAFLTMMRILSLAKSIQ